MTFGERVRALRLGADFTQRELAQRAGLDFTYLSRIEAGVVPPPADDKIRALGAAVGLNRAGIDELLDLGHQGKIPSDVVKAALIRNPEIGALLRQLKDQRLSDRQIAAMIEIVGGDSRPLREDSGEEG